MDSPYFQSGAKKKFPRTFCYINLCKRGNGEIEKCICEDVVRNNCSESELLRREGGSWAFRTVSLVKNYLRTFLTIAKQKDLKAQKILWKSSKKHVF